jgi:formylglycine-generating enzyme required for sulfatase activity
MLEKGHYNVKLDKEGWDRIITWMDLNAPYHGTWTEAGANTNIIARRLDLRAKHTGVSFNPEKIVNPYEKRLTAVMPETRPAPAAPPGLKGWPMAPDEAARLQGGSEPLSIDLGNGVSMKLVSIPAGSFLIGSTNETPMEAPVSKVDITRPFWMAATEVTLEQYRQFDTNYLNGVYDMHYKDQVKRGYYMNNMKFPVVRVSWESANAFCKWLSEKSGRKISLPTEAQWEWACRAGSADPFSYGGLDTDFGAYANLADVTRRELTVQGVNPRPIPNPPPDLDFELKDNRFYDKSLHLAPVGTYKANTWGLFDMHGNAAEWTSSPYMPYPFAEGGEQDTRKRVVRGGSFTDRPFRSTSSYRLGYSPWQRVFNVGFRIIIEE